MGGVTGLQRWGVEGGCGGEAVPSLDVPPLSKPPAEVTDWGLVNLPDSEPAPRRRRAPTDGLTDQRDDKGAYCRRGRAPPRRRPRYGSNLDPNDLTVLCERVPKPKS